MFLVAGLAVAGLAGIVAAFYFSIRSGNRGDKRLQPARSGRSGTGRAARASSRDFPRDDGTGEHPALDFGEPVLIGGRRGSQAPTAGSRTGGDGRRAGTPPARSAGSRRPARPAGSRPLGDRLEPNDPHVTNPRLSAVKTSESSSGSGSAESPSSEDHPAWEDSRPRRRMGFRKGADVDEELWPAETFGGVSDEQFWDDLAADKPITTAVRTAQQHPGRRKRPPDTGPATGPQARQAKGEDRGREDRTREDRGRGHRRRGAGSQSRTAPDSATGGTLIQPAYPATQPVPSMTPQVPGATRLVHTGAGGGQPASATRQSASVASRPGATAQPAETRSRRPASSTDEDPLTSAAFALRPSGPVDGRSSLRSGGSRSGGSGPGSASTYDGASQVSPRPYVGVSYGDPPSVTQTMTPPHGENYGHGSGGSAPSADDSRRANGTRSHAQATRTGGGTRSVRQVYPRDSHPARNRHAPGGYHGTGAYAVTGGHPGTGVYPGTGGYPAGGYPGAGYQAGGYPGRAAYDPRAGYRLTHQR